MEDPFGDDGDFTVDDLEEIDVIASQALTQDVSLKTCVVQAERKAGPSSPLNSGTKTSDHVKQWNLPLTTARTSSGRLGSCTDETSSKDKFRFETLQAQYEEAKKKLKEMNDEILIKNGEIKVLRDSMQQMESNVDEQRKSYILLEKERAQTLSEKEKEFARKLQSLQSELQFRDAEMNELRMRLLNCEKLKPVTPSVSNISPKKSRPHIIEIEGLTQNDKKYPTKESFGSDIPPKASCSRTQLLGQTPLINKDSKMPELESELVKQEMSCVYAQRQGSILINALMKQPIVAGSSLGLCSLLSSSDQAWPGPVLQPSSFSTGSTRSLSNRTTDSQEEDTLLRIAQKRALTGLNLIAIDEGSLEDSSEENKRSISHLKCYKIPGAVHFLPLLEHHISSYYQALQLMMKIGNASSGNQSACSSRTSSNATSSADDLLSTLEEFALASLGILYYLVFYSWDVVYTLLSLPVKPHCDLGDTELLEKDKAVVCDKQYRANQQEPNPELDVSNDDQNQHPLFKKLLQLLTLCTATGCQRQNIMNQCLRVLVKLAEKPSVDLLISFQHLLNSQTQTLLRCLSSEAPFFAVHLTVKLLTSLAEHQELAAQFCSCSETCLLLAVYMYITSRPDKSASEMLWLQVEQETVHFLTKCMQCGHLSALLVGTNCQCNSEVVKALIIMLHRQWLTVRRVERNLFDARGKRVVQFLRDTVLLLHSLSQKDKLFHEHCLEVLHQYDDVMPGVRAILKKVPNLKAYEELAVDELYPLEPEVDDQQMECS
ncbi:ATR-interacting protein isoform X2 [Hemicordylus capensis]|nr:ATR-interacting protein isoform X2 [Hemicordylus capensis]